MSDYDDYWDEITDGLDDLSAALPTVRNPALAVTMPGWRRAVRDEVQRLQDAGTLSRHHEMAVDHLERTSVARETRTGNRRMSRNPPTTMGGRG